MNVALRKEDLTNAKLIIEVPIELSSAFD
jgi:hypothetical protein